jgi:Zn-dependent peptidase ImmA (M78 family)/DNA-binding XRE family transcriptional regulator
MRKFNPDMMILARECQGIFQSALAKTVGLTQATISRYESGLVEPPGEHVEKIAVALDRPVSYFFMDERLYAASSLFHRKRQSLSVREEKRIHAQVNELRIRCAVLLREAEIRCKFQFHRLDATKRTPEYIARMLRQLWQLPSGPIRSVVNAIERAGGIVFRCPFGTHKVDGISQWPLDADHVPPVFFVNEDIPGDRERWTLSHELGHIVMHHLPTDDPEREANRFAAEFLMPSREIATELHDLTLPKAAALKAFWKVSMAAIIWRAYQLQRITERQYRYLNTQLASRGYKRCEPVPIPPEEPELLKDILDVHRRHYVRNLAALSAMLGMHEHQFREQFWRGVSGLRIAV